MKRRVAFFDGNKSSATCGANLSAPAQGSFDRCAVVPGFNDMRAKQHGAICRCRTQQLDCIICRHCAGHTVIAVPVHQMPGRHPIAVTIEQCPDNSPVQDAWERFVFPLRLPFGHEFIAASEAANVQAFGIGRATTPAGILRRVFLLERLFLRAHVSSHRKIVNRYIGLSRFSLHDSRFTDSPARSATSLRRAALGGGTWVRPRFGSGIKRARAD
jgi:hypothetical protein